MDAGRNFAEKRFSLPQFFNIAVPLADAMAAAQQQGITRRDLKPANINAGSLTGR